MAKVSRWKPECVEQTRKLCMLGATNVQLADFFRVSVTTFDNWVKKYPDLRHALDEGKMIADANVAHSMYKLATGFTLPDTDIRVIKGVVVKTPIMKVYAPNAIAAIFWLKNRSKENWRDRQELDHSGKIGYEGLTDDELAKKLAELKASVPE